MILRLLIVGFTLALLLLHYELTRRSYRRGYKDGKAERDLPRHP